MAGIIIVLLFYAGFFAYSGHAVNCVYKEATGIACPTCGLTRAFHQILTGDFKKAEQFNAMSFRLFAFFGIQLIGRLFLIFGFLTKKSYPVYFITTDIIASVVLFLVCFLPLIIGIFT